MPRAQMYVSTKNYKRIQAIAEAKREDGADRNETSISSICSMLLEMGLRIYEYQQKKELDETAGMAENGQFDQSLFNKTLLEHVVRNSYASTILLQMAGKMDEVKGVESFNYENLKNIIRVKTNDEVSKMFSEVRANTISE